MNIRYNKISFLVLLKKLGSKLRLVFKNFLLYCTASLCQILSITILGDRPYFAIRKSLLQRQSKKSRQNYFQE